MIQKVTEGFYERFITAGVIMEEGVDVVRNKSEIEFNEIGA